MRRGTTRDHTIVVRMWLEPHHDEPCARVIRVSPGDERTACGFDDIVRQFDAMLRATFDET